MDEGTPTWMREPGDTRAPLRPKNWIGRIAFLLTLLPPLAVLAGYLYPLHAATANTVGLAIIPVAFVVGVMGVFRKPRKLALVALLIALVEVQLLTLAFPTLLSETNPSNRASASVFSHPTVSPVPQVHLVFLACR